MFFRSLLIKLDNKINQWLNRESSSHKETRIDDFDKVNPFNMVLKRVLNRCFFQSEFEVTADSLQAEPLIELCEDLHKNRYKIGARMLGGSDTPANISECWAVPYFETIGGKQKLQHNYIGGDRIIITAMKADRITECCMVLDAVKKNTIVYLLCRKHIVDDNGNLTISYFIANEQAKEVSASIPEWEAIVKQEITYPGANHIGFGRYKSPVLSLSEDDVYGKPLNYGCAVIEEKIQACLVQIEKEFAHKEVKLFADDTIVKSRDKDGNPLKAHVIDEYIYPIKSLAGVNDGGSFISEFSPAIRESSYYTHLTELLKQYEALCGLNNMITHDVSAGATATEIRMLNIDNMSMEDNIKHAIGAGNRMTLEADCIYLGIPLNRDMWTYTEVWEDIYQDTDKRTEDELKMYEAGANEQLDLIKYWHPALSDEEAREKLERIKDERSNANQSALEGLLNM